MFPFGQKSFRQVITKHMGKEPTKCPIVTEHFEKYNHPNIHLAIEAFTKESLKTPGRTTATLGRLPVDNAMFSMDMITGDQPKQSFTTIYGAYSVTEIFQNYLRPARSSPN